jgi:hypothetical protein
MPSSGRKDQTSSQDPALNASMRKTNTAITLEYDLQVIFHLAYDFQGHDRIYTVNNLDSISSDLYYIAFVPKRRQHSTTLRIQLEHVTLPQLSSPMCRARTNTSHPMTVFRAEERLVHALAIVVAYLTCPQEIHPAFPKRLATK